MLKVVGIGEYLVSLSSEEIIRTYALGSCVALVLHFPAAKIGGMVHVVLPDSVVSRSNAPKRPGYYADTAVSLLVEEMRKAIIAQGYGSLHGTVAKLVGGAKVFKMKSDYKIGERLVKTIEQQLKQYQIPLTASDVGGTKSRTVSIEVESGRVLVASPGRKERPL